MLALSAQLFELSIIFWSLDGWSVNLKSLGAINIVNLLAIVRSLTLLQKQLGTVNAKILTEKQGYF